MGLRNETGTHRGHHMRKRIEPVGIPRIHAGEDVKQLSRPRPILRWREERNLGGEGARWLQPESTRFYPAWDGENT
jgi:hypothetical protein